MERKKFDEIVDCIIRPVGEILQKRHSLDWRGHWERDLYLTYENERATIRKSMGLDILLGNHRIDRHKIASALAYAILEIKPFDPPKIKSPSPEARLANEFLAIFTSMQVIMHFVEQRLSEMANPEIAKINGILFAFPESHDGPFRLHFAKALYHSKKNSFPTYLTSSAFFLIEHSFLRRQGVALPALTPCQAEQSEA